MRFQHAYLRVGIFLNYLNANFCQLKHFVWEYKISKAYIDPPVFGGNTLLVDYPVVVLLFLYYTDPGRIFRRGPLHLLKEHSVRPDDCELADASALFLAGQVFRVRVLPSGLATQPAATLSSGKTR